MATEKSVMGVIRASWPSFRNPHDKVAFVLHASFFAAGYSVLAVDPSATFDHALSSSYEVGIDGWNKHKNNYAFVYGSSESSKKVLVKCLVMDDKLLIDVLCEGTSEPLHLEINVDDYAGEDEGVNYSSKFKNMEKLVGTIESEILSKLSLPRFSSDSTSYSS